MSHELSALDMHYLVSELQALKDSRVDKIYSPGKKEILLQLFMTGAGRKILRINAPKYFYLSDSKEEQPERPSGFCTLLRKYLDSTRLREIRQRGFERIIEIVFEGKESSYILVAELFSKGNIVLCKEDYTIIMPAESQDWKGRSIRPKHAYVSPKREHDFLSTDEGGLMKASKGEGKSAVKLLATDMGLGGRYAEEVCALAGISKDKTSLDEEDIKRILQARKKLVSEEVSPRIYLEDGKIKAFAPFRLASLEGLQAKDFKSYNEAISSVLSKEIESGADSKKLTRHNAKVEKLLNIIRSQEAYLAELEKEVEEEKSKGEAIYTNYKMIGEIVAEIEKARKKYSLREIKEKVKGHSVVKDIKEKEKSVVLELG